MAAGDVTQGRRLPDDTDIFAEAALAPGDYVLREGVVWAIEPEGGRAMMKLDGWTTTVHEDGTISLAPSIHVNPPNGWHGYLEHGVWRQI